MGKVSKARWYQNSPDTLILKEPLCLGGKILATITEHHHFLFVWQLTADPTIGGHAQTRYAAMRRARKALA